MRNVEKTRRRGLSDDEHDLGRGYRLNGLCSYEHMKLYALQVSMQTHQLFVIILSSTANVSL